MKPINEMNLEECLVALDTFAYRYEGCELADGDEPTREITELADRLRELHELTRWIPVEERLPTEADADLYGNVLKWDSITESPQVDSWNHFGTHRVYLALMKHIIWRFNTEILQFYAQFDRAYITIAESFGIWSWSIYDGDYKDDNSTFLEHGKSIGFHEAKAESLQAIERIYPGITDPYHDLRKRIEELAGRYPYKQVGNPDSYSSYNEGYTDAINDLRDLLR